MLSSFARWLSLIALAACGYRTPPEVPGTTEIPIRDVSIVADSGSSLTVSYKKLYDTLGIRVGSRIRPERPFNPFRLAEDRRRIQAHAQLFGHFEATVAEPKVERDDRGVEIVWSINEGPAYRIGTVEIVGAPEGTEGDLRAMIPFDKGDGLDLLVYRPLRRELAEALQAQGYGHARVYSRAWLDRNAKTVAWYYFVDSGPKTVIGSIEVDGNSRIPAETILARSGLRVGEPYSTRAKKRAELALLDAGSLRSVVVRNDADILTGPPQWPDTGGTPAVTASGDMKPRSLDPAINLRLVVVEAPSRELRIEAGGEADPARLDVFAGARTLFRDVGAPNNHVVAEAAVGYGWELSGDDEPLGVYGSALLRIIRASAIGQRVDLRLSGSLRQDLFPSSSVREFAVGPGARSVLADNTFFDLDVFYAHAEQLDFGPFDDATRQQFSLADDDTTTGARLTSSLVYDKRNDRIEALRGHLAAAYLELSPGGSLASHRWLKLTGDLRKFFPLTPAVSLGVRGSASVIVFDDDSGVPLGARLFGGGSWGFRGNGRQQLSPSADDTLVGGLSLAETSLELRFLPFRELYGAVAFVDFAGVGDETNPFSDGLSSAVGLGARARSFYVPVSIDFSFRYLEESEFVGPGDFDRWSLFFRIGEAF